MGKTVGIGCHSVIYWHELQWVTQWLWSSVPLFANEDKLSYITRFWNGRYQLPEGKAWRVWSWEAKLYTLVMVTQNPWRIFSRDMGWSGFHISKFTLVAEWRLSCTGTKLKNRTSFRKVLKHRGWGPTREREFVDLEQRQDKFCR